MAQALGETRGGRKEDNEEGRKRQRERERCSRDRTCIAWQAEKETSLWESSSSYDSASCTEYERGTVFYSDLAQTFLWRSHFLVISFCAVSLPPLDSHFISKEFALIAAITFLELVPPLRTFPPFEFDRQRAWVAWITGGWFLYTR